MEKDIEEKIADLLPEYRKLIMPFASKIDIYRFVRKDCPILINDFDETRLNKAKYDIDKQYHVWFSDKDNIYKLLKKYDCKSNLYLIEIPGNYPTGDQEALLDAIADCKCKVILLGPVLSMYSEYLTDWHFEPISGLGDLERNLWLNFNGAEQLELI